MRKKMDEKESNLQKMDKDSDANCKGAFDKGSQKEERGSGKAKSGQDYQLIYICKRLLFLFTLWKMH
jgi:hypothetical protein